MATDLDAFACPSCGETLYAHKVKIAGNGDFTCPSCGGKANTSDVVDLSEQHERDHHGEKPARAKKGD